MSNKPSVTKIIGLLDKPALLGWANKIGLQGIKLDDYRKKSTESGTNLHKQIEDFILYKTPFEDKNLEVNFNEFFKDKEILEVEKKIETEWFQGRLDIKFKHNDKIFIGDFKSNQKYVYFENKLQLTAYRMAENCDNVVIISIPDFKIVHSGIRDFVPYEKILKCLSFIYTTKESLE